MSNWWLGLSPAWTTVECREQRHRLRWERGELVALDHDDLDGERTLGVLAGEPCACVQVIDRWRRCATYLRVLTLASRGPADVVRLEPDGAPWAPSAAVGVVNTMYVPVGRRPPPVFDEDGEPDDDDPTPLLSLGGGVAERLAAGVAAYWRDRAGERDVERYAALYGRLVATLRAWLGEPDLMVDLELAAPGEPPVLVREGPTVRAALPFAWVPDVWMRGLATVAGRLTLAATPNADGTRWALTTVNPDFGSPGDAVLELPS